MNQTFVFIVGCPRSGTTFLRKAMAGLSGVFEIARETAFFRNYWGRYGDLRIPSNLSALVRDFTKTRAFGAAQVNPDAFAQALVAEPEMDYGRFFVTFANLSSLARNGTRARIIVEKTPTHTFCIDRIRRTFPEAKFIGLIRDPYAVVSSKLEWNHAPLNMLFRFRRWIIVAATLEWLGHYEEIMLQASALGSEQFFVLSYERLVREHMTTMQGLAEFIGAPLDLGEDFIEPVESSLHKYRERLSDKEMALIGEILCENNAAAFCKPGMRRGSVPLTDKAIVYPLYKVQTFIADRMGPNSKLYLFRKFREFRGKTVPQ